MKKTLIIALFVVALFMSACAGNSPEGQVKATFENFVAAMKNVDLEKMKSLLTDQGLKDIDMDEGTVKIMSAFIKPLTFTIKDIKIDGDTATATVNVKGEMMGEKVDDFDPWQFKLVDGKWLVSEMK